MVRTNDDFSVVENVGAYITVNLVIYICTSTSHHINLKGIVPGYN